MGFVKKMFAPNIDIPEPPPVPDLEAEAAEARRLAIERAKKRKGRRSTIKTTGLLEEIPIKPASLLGE